MKETEILRGLGKAREATKQNGSRSGPSPLHDLRRGAASLRGPGTSTSDSIPAHLSKGEAVLPAKTVAALGPQNVATVIQQTAGKAPKPGLRAGGHYALGEVSNTGVQGIQTGSATMQDFNDARNGGINQNFRQASNATMGSDARFTQQPQAAQPQNPPTGATPQPTPQATPQPSPQPTPQPAEPAATGLRGRAQGIWNGVKNFATKTTPEAAGDAVDGAKGLATKWGTKTLAGVGGLIEGGRTLNDVMTPGMNSDQKNGRILEGLTRVGSAALGGMAGTALGGPVGGITLGGLAAGYGPELANSAGNYIEGKLHDWTGGWWRDPKNDPSAQMPSDVASNLRTAQRNAQFRQQQAQSPEQQAPAPALPPGDAGRGAVNPAYVNGATEAQYPSQNSVLKTVGPDGKVTYSGQNIKADGMSMHGADGRATGLRGSVQSTSGAPTFGPNGSYVVPTDGQPTNLRAALAGPNGQQMSLQDVAVMQANQRDGIDLYKGTSQDQSAQPSAQGAGGGMRQLLMQRAAANLKNFGVMGNHTMAALQDMDRTDIDRQRMNNEANYQQGELGARRDLINKDYDVAQMNNQREMTRLTSELGQQGEKGFNEDNMNSPYATAFDRDKKQDVKSQAEADNLGQFLKANSGQYTADGKPVNLPMLRATKPDAYNQLRSNAEAMYGFGKKANDYAGATLFGQQSGWAGPKISDIRDMDLGDFTKGSSIADAASAKFKAGVYRKGVVLDVGGRKQVVPVGDLISDPKNGGQYRQVINNWLAKNKRPILGDSLTGE